MSIESVKIHLRDYVNRNSDVINLEWDPELSERLIIDVFDKTDEGIKRVAHYFLLVASITETKLIGRAENARAVMIHLHRILGEKLFEETDIELLQQLVSSSFFYNDMGPERSAIAEILASVNNYVSKMGDGNIQKYISRFKKPTNLVEDISQNIQRMGGIYIEKPWMYLRWCTRPYPDLGIFDNFSHRDLLLPLTSYTCDVARCLGLCPEQGDEWWFNLKEREKARQKLTEFGGELFPEDPARIDYPFYLLGRWIRGREPSIQLLEEYLIFFDELYRKTGNVPVKYDIVSRKMSTFEESLRRELLKTNIMFYFESLRFNLPDGFTYKPDFVLPQCKIKGKTVLLEPHGVWGSPERRRVRIGTKVIKFQAYGTKPNESEVQFTDKTRLFRETFGRDYYLILLVPSRVKERVEKWYINSFDEVYDGADIPELLFKLKNS